MKKLTLIILMFLAVLVFAQVADPPSNGTGTEVDPYQITTLNELYWIRTDALNLDKSYILMNDIDASDTKNWFGGQGWEPIGELYSPFTGEFDGFGYCIDNLTLKRDNSNHGFFGCLADSAYIKGLGLTNVYVYSWSKTGALAGYCINSKVESCYSTGKVAGGYDTGGLIGWVSGSNISRCYSICMVEGNDRSSDLRVPSIVRNAGGLIGNITDSSIADSYSFSSVRGDSNIGGFVGLSNGNTDISNCFSAGKVTGSSEIGGFIGVCDTTAVNIDCFWDTESSGTVSMVGSGDTTGIEGKTTAEMRDPLTFNNWDILNIWDIISSMNMGYPYIRSTGAYDEPIIEIYVILEDLHSVNVGSTFLYDPHQDIIQHGICWNDTGEPSLSDNITEQGVLGFVGDFSSTATELDYSSKYFRSYVSNGGGTLYSVQEKLDFQQMVYRQNDSTFVYSCIANDTTTSFNFVGLPLETNFVNASDFDSLGVNIDAISWWDKTKYRWFTAGHHPALGWANDFPVETGGAYMLSAKNDFDFNVVGDSVRIVYDISYISTIILPLTEPDLYDTWKLGDDIEDVLEGGLCNAIRKFSNITQEWEFTFRSM